MSHEGKEAAPAQPEERVKLSDTVGDFVEMHEVQLPDEGWSVNQGNGTAGGHG